ncbi:MAG: hypothetical protein Kow0025_24310 [Thermodesulfovibrionales bacterium]
MGLFSGLGSIVGFRRSPEDPDQKKLNEPCWCGSGKKYRKCHLYEDYKKVTQKIPLNEHG